MRRTIVVDWILDNDRIIVPKGEILGIPFHSRRVPLLDQVTISNDKAIGEFVVPIERCQGRERHLDKPVLGMGEFLEIAGQFLVVLVTRIPRLANSLKGKVFTPEESGGIKRYGFVRPNDRLLIETGPHIHIIKDTTGEIVKIESVQMTATVSNDLRGIVSSVAVEVFDPTRSASHQWVN